MPGGRLVATRDGDSNARLLEVHDRVVAIDGPVGFARSREIEILISDNRKPASVMRFDADMTNDEIGIGLHPVGNFNRPLPALYEARAQHVAVLQVMLRHLICVAQPGNAPIRAPNAQHCPRRKRRLLRLVEPLIRIINLLVNADMGPAESDNSAMAVQRRESSRIAD